MTDKPASSESPGILSITLSVLAAMFGVQTEKNRVRDFNQKNPLPYIIIGALFIILFVLTILSIVSLVLRLV
ncbi:MAG: DUF2970 domain-containing protein [Idiomarina sp.]|nr:DUF2970 domain-containing protein [Idiomarina sp.]